jgi:thymidylate synthase (FAD)
MMRFIKEPPRVFVVGASMPVMSGVLGYAIHRDINLKAESLSNRLSPAYASAEALIEFGGRVCYNSFDNKRGRDTQEYIQKSIIAMNHGSVLEHLSINFAVAGLPRSTQLELIRHRVGVAYSFRSTRFVDDWLEFAIPPLIRGTPMEESFKEQCLVAEEAYNKTLQEIGEYHDEATRKQRKEAARALLPNALTSDGLITMNIRTIRHVVTMRTDQGADASFREFALALYSAAKPWAPYSLAGKVEQNGTVSFDP